MQMDRRTTENSPGITKFELQHGNPCRVMRGIPRYLLNIAPFSCRSTTFFAMYARKLAPFSSNLMIVSSQKLRGADKAPAPLLSTPRRRDLSIDMECALTILNRVARRIRSAKLNIMIASISGGIYLGLPAPPWGAMSGSSYTET